MKGFVVIKKMLRLLCGKSKTTFFYYSKWLLRNNIFFIRKQKLGYKVIIRIKSSIFCISYHHFKTHKGFHLVQWFSTSGSGFTGNIMGLHVHVYCSLYYSVQSISVITKLYLNNKYLFVLTMIRYNHVRYHRVWLYYYFCWSLITKIWMQLI
jgi:hypothetical protein